MLGPRFSRLVHAAIASGALILGACSDSGKGATDSDTASTTDDPTDGPPGDPTFPPSPTDPLPPTPPPPPPPPPADLPPALLRVKLLDPATLQLSFTEPLAPVDAVNPKRFRLSLAQAYSGDYGGDPSTFLVDPRLYNFDVVCTPEKPCYYEPPYNYYDCYYGPACYYQSTGPLNVVGLAPLAGDPTSLVLTLSTAIRPSVCDIIELINGSTGFTGVLHLHYAAGGQAQITDLSGQPLPSLGAEWVKSSDDIHSYDGPPFATLDPFLPIPCEIQ